MSLKKVTSFDQLKLVAQRAKAKYDALSTRIDEIVDEGGEPNTIETVKVNGTALVPDGDKAVDITVPTKVSDLTNDELFQTETQVDDKISAAVVGALKPAGSVAFANLPALEEANVNKIVNVTDAFTTTANFVEGAGIAYPAGTNVAIIEVSAGTYQYDTYTGVVDTSGFVTKVSGATLGNFAGLDADGNITDSGSKAADFVAAETGKRLMTDEEGTKLAGIAEGATKVTSSTTNGNILVNDAETTVYTLPDTVLQDENVATDDEVTAMLDEVFA